ncbi:MAG: hypothetical protein IJ198_01815 [Lachnospiraceae bacterium]|nr:hypothetical protein [Lachnospiraceae bacterium]
MKRKPFLLLLCLALLLPLLFMGICAVGLPAKYDATYMGELKYKVRRLSSVGGPKIVLVGGSSAAFGTDSSLIEKEFPDYEVVNFGMYAALGSRMMLDLAQRGIGEGDIVIFMPEINEQTLSDFTDGAYALQGLDGAWHLLGRIRPDLYPSVLGAMPAFAMEKLRCQLAKTVPDPGALYRRDSFNEYGDVDSDMVSRNIMPEEYDPDLPVVMSDELPTEEFADYLNDYSRKLGKKGASFYYHFCPVNELAVAGDMSALAFYAHLDAVLDFPLLGDPREAVMEAGWFYDTNFHLNRAGKTAFTRQLVRDLKAALGDTSLTEIDVPAMPRSLAFSQISDKEDSVLRRSTYAGNTEITQITVPETVRRIEDGAFDGCTSLEAIYLEAKEPSQILVGRHLLDGTDADLFVPEESLSAYRTDYRFSQYADRIRAR